MGLLVLERDGWRMIIPFHDKISKFVITPYWNEDKHIQTFAQNVIMSKQTLEDQTGWEGGYFCHIHILKNLPWTSETFPSKNFIKINTSVRTPQNGIFKKK